MLNAGFQRKWTHGLGHPHDADVAVEAASGIHVHLFGPEDHLGIDDAAPGLLVAHSLQGGRRADGQGGRGARIRRIELRTGVITRSVEQCAVWESTLLRRASWGSCSLQ